MVQAIKRMLEQHNGTASPTLHKTSLAANNVQCANVNQAGRYIALEQSNDGTH